MNLRDANLQLWEKKLFHTSYFMYFVFNFSEYIKNTSSEEALKVREHNFFQEIYTESTVTCYLPVQLRFIPVNFLHVEYGIWHSLWVQFLLSKLGFFVSCNNIKITRTSFFLLCVLICNCFYKNLILHHGDNNFLLWHLYQTGTFNNNLNDEEMIKSHLMGIWEKWDPQPIRGTRDLEP